MKKLIQRIKRERELRLKRKIMFALLQNPTHDVCYTVMIADDLFRYSVKGVELKR